MKDASAHLASAEVVTFPTKYPSGGEKQLIELLLNVQVPSGGIPADIGVLCQNPGTAMAVRAALIDGKPLTDRITTLTGMALGKPGNRRPMPSCCAPKRPQHRFFNVGCIQTPASLHLY